MNNIPCIYCGIGSDIVTAIKINSCSDSLLWYSGLVGKYVPFVRQLLSENCFISREQDGYTNIVRLTDAELVEVEESAIDYY